MQTSAEMFGKNDISTARGADAAEPAGGRSAGWLTVRGSAFAGLFRLGCVLLMMLGGLLVWWGILALVGDATAAAAAGWACLIVFALWLTNGTALAMLLVRVLLTEGWPADTEQGGSASTVDSARPPEAATETPPAVATARPGPADLEPTEATGLAAAGEHTTGVRGDQRPDVSEGSDQSTVPHADRGGASSESSQRDQDS